MLFPNLSHTEPQSNACAGSTQDSTPTVSRTVTLSRKPSRNRGHRSCVFCSWAILEKQTNCKGGANGFVRRTENQISVCHSASSGSGHSGRQFASAARWQAVHQGHGPVDGSGQQSLGRNQTGEPENG